MSVKGFVETVCIHPRRQDPVCVNDGQGTAAQREHKDVTSTQRCLGGDYDEKEKEAKGEERGDGGNGRSGSGREEGLVAGGDSVVSDESFSSLGRAAGLRMLEDLVLRDDASKACLASPGTPPHLNSARA